MSNNFFIFLVVGLVFSPQDSFAKPGDPLYIEVSASKLRTAARPLASPIAELHYGDALTEVSQQSGWYEVKLADGRQGFIHQTAVTPKKVVLKTKQGLATEAFGEGDVVLAGKGFNKEIESGFASGDQSLNYEAVNRMEHRVVPEAELARFLADGKLKSES